VLRALGRAVHHEHGEGGRDHVDDADDGFLGMRACRTRVSEKRVAPPTAKASAYQYAASLWMGWPARKATVTPRAATWARARSTKMTPRASTCRPR
jgi:hypothetical protein